MSNNDEHYPIEVLGEDYDDGTMPANVTELSDAVVGHKIVSAEKTQVESYWSGTEEALVLTLDNGHQVELVNTNDCCAYTEVEAFLLNPSMVDHIITGVGTTDGYTTWHIFADLGDVLTMTVGWSCGNPFYYGYGLSIKVKEQE